MHWWIGCMGLLYALSSLTVVRPDQVAVVLRWGRLVGASPALQQHGPGLLLALPRPIDQVIRVPIKRSGRCRSRRSPRQKPSAMWTRLAGPLWIR